LLSIVVPGIIGDLRNVVRKLPGCATSAFRAEEAAAAIDAQVRGRRHNGVRRWFGSRSRRSPSNVGPKESIREGREDKHSAKDCVKRDGML